MYELRQKEVINIKDGARYGFVADMEIDEEKGSIIKIIVPGPTKLFGIFGAEQEFRIPWDCIKQIGEDIILVEIETDKALKDCD
jgi:YlmC/YmxH family sporulation protein